MNVIVTNHVNWHIENLRSDRENTGNLKRKLEWVPCIIVLFITKCLLSDEFDNKNNSTILLTTKFEMIHEPCIRGFQVALDIHRRCFQVSKGL